MCGWVVPLNSSSPALPTLPNTHPHTPHYTSTQFAEKYKDFGAQLEFVTNRSQEGSQFVKGFGGIGGLLRYKLDFATFTYDSDDYFSD